MERLIDIAPRFADGTNQATKLSASGLYELYEGYFRELADQPLALLELGVHSGESLKTFATYFPNGKIIGIDIEDRGADFSAHPNITFAVGDQRDEAQLARICRLHAPDGLDIIIDDASHVGAWSLESYTALLPYLKPGGLYIIEDWATGYWDDWPDGSAFDKDADGKIVGKRIQSHDFGMVGFVKYLVGDVVGTGPTMGAPTTKPNRLDWVHVLKGMVVLKKAL